MENQIQLNKFSLIGYFLSEIGLGQTIRNFAYALQSENIPANYVNAHLQGRSNDLEFHGQRTPYEAGNINFVVAGINDAGMFFDQFKKLGLGRKNVIYPLWELDRVPHELINSLNLYDEVIAPSQFIADTLSIHLNKNIKKIPHPIKIPSSVQPNKIKDGILKIYSFMDLDSYYERKNPLGVLEAFSAAFPVQYRDVELILKVRGVNLVSRDELHAFSSKDNRIKIIDKTLSRIEVDVLMSECNVFLSMHRSEGFGLGPAEALLSEKIVGATNYGGTTDFIDVNTGFPVDYKMVPIKPRQYPYWYNQLWADPSIESAASALRFIYNNFDEAQRRAIYGRNLMLDQHSYKVVANKMRLLL